MNNGTIHSLFIINSKFRNIKKSEIQRRLQITMQKRDTGKAYWEEIVGYRTLLQSGLIIYPTVNMVENVGTSQNATHAPDNIRELPKEIQEMFITRAQDVAFPLKHPPYVIEDYHYYESMIKRLNPGGMKKILRKIEHAYRKYLKK